MSSENPDDLVSDEIYASMKAFEERAQQPYIKGLMPKIKHLLATAVEVKIYSEVRAGR